MTPITIEWVTKAEADFESAEWVRQPGAPVPPDLICFLAQQSAEKYLKALLQERGIAFPRTHDLPTLLNLVVPAVSELDALRIDLHGLSALAVSVRYPGYFADEPKATHAVNVATNVRRIVRGALGLPA